MPYHVISVDRLVQVTGLDDAYIRLLTGILIG